jgi:membrane fusion protein (multidrug efflux system)
MKTEPSSVVRGRESDVILATRGGDISRTRWTVACLTLAGLGLAGCNPSSQQAPAAAPTAEVGVITLHPQAVTITATAPGRAVASGYSEIRPQVDGLIQKVVFTEGSEVKAGDLLYQIDPSSYEAAYQSAEATLQKAQAAVPSAQAKVDRYNSLVGANTITAQNLDDAKSTLLQGQADVASAQAAVRIAQINLDFTKVTAPIGGLINVSSVTQGALVTAKQTTALATIRQVNPVYVDLQGSSTNGLRIRRLLSSGTIETTGKPPVVHITLEDGTPYDQTGTLRSAEAAISETTGTVSLRVDIANPKRMLLPGMYVQAVIDLGIDKAGILVPQRAVDRNAKGAATAMFVTKDGKVETRVLDTQQSVGTSWLVDKGVADGDQLIVDGLQKIRDGQAVKATEVKLDADGVVIGNPAASAPAAAAPAAMN